MTYIFVAIFGAIVGSFLNALLARIHAGQSMLAGRSHCMSCKAELSVMDLFPIASFVSLRGKCRYCNEPIGAQYLWVEVACAALFVLVYFCALQGWSAIEGIGSTIHPMFLLARNWFFVAILVAIFVYDMRHGLIPDRLSIPAIVMAFFLNGLLVGMGSTCDISWDCPLSLLNMLLAGSVGGGFFLLQFLLSKGKWIGGGDIRMGFLMGCMVGWPLIFPALLIAYGIGSLVAIPLLILQKKRGDSEIVFGTFLSGATILVLLFYQPIFSLLSRYLFL